MSEKFGLWKFVNNIEIIYARNAFSGLADGECFKLLLIKKRFNINRLINDQIGLSICQFILSYRR